MARGSVTGHPADRGIHDAPLHTRRGHLRSGVAKAARLVRARRAGGCPLSTRVDIARERQSQALLASMDRRAKAQLRLQQAVEDLSVAAIVYYAAGLAGYLTKGLKSAGVGLEPDMLIGASILLLFVAVFIVTRRARRRLSRDERLHHLPDSPEHP